MLPSQRSTRFAVAAALLCALNLACSAGSPAGDTYFPQQILIIRHAEKPKEAGDVHLAQEGKARAQKLFQLFAESKTRPDPFPTPDFIFATRDSKNSHRPRKTVTPLAKKLGLPVNSEYDNKKKGKTGVRGLSAEIFKGKKYAGKIVLVCWHHGTMPELAKALLANSPNETAKVPKEFDKKRFDLVWQITFDKDGKATFTVRPQQLMPGDKAAPAAKSSLLAPRAPGLASARGWARAG
jgi:phosphohistidine phosphatase SixA